MADIVLSVRAYCKMILHLMKFPHCGVNGVFLAGKKKYKENGTSIINIVDCVPLFHLSIGLTPMMEAALLQIDSYCKSENLVIAGYYQANENFSESNPDNIAYRVADKVNENFSEACLVMIDNQKLSVSCDEVGIQVYQLQDNKWKQKDKNCVHLEQGNAALGVTSALLQAKAYRNLVDFDNHLDNIRLDWTNQPINAEISRCS